MTERKKQPNSKAAKLSERELDSVQGGYTATDDLEGRKSPSGGTRGEAIIGGFKSVAGMDSETE